MSRLLKLSLWLILSATAIGQVTVTATLTDGTGTTYRTAYLHFQLQNCGANIPVTTGTTAIVQDSFDLRPASPGGSISGTVIGNDQILCGNVKSTSYLIVPMKDSTHPLRDGETYIVCSASSTLGTCGNQASLGSFNLVTAIPTSQNPPSPGFTELYGNPTNTQTLTQPGGSQMNFVGTMNFCSATVLCGGGGGGSVSVNGSTVTSPNFNGTTPAAGANSLNVIWQFSGSSVSAAVPGDGNAAHCLLGTGVFSTCPGGGGGGNITVNGGAPLTYPINFSGGTNTSAGTAGSTIEFNVVPPGPPGSVQFAGSGVLATDSTFSYSSGSKTLSTQNLAITGPLYLTTTIPVSPPTPTASLSAIAVGSDGNPYWSNNGGAFQEFAFGSGVPSTAQVGDTVRYNVNGDSAWDAVNYAQPSVRIFSTNQSTALAADGFLGSAAPAVLGSGSSVLPTYTSQAALLVTSAASGSTSTVIGTHFGENGSVSLLGMNAFYRWTMKAAVGNTTNVRYWFGLGCVNSGGTGNNGAAIVGTTAYATDTPNKTTVGFRFSAGTDTHWQAVSNLATGGSGTRTIVDTGVTPDTNPHLFEITTTAAGTAYNFFIDGTAVGTISTNVPNPASGGDSYGDLFFTGDNKNTATAVSLSLYYMLFSIK